MTIAVAVAIAIKSCHEDMTLATCWWHTMTTTVAVKVFREVVKLAISVLVEH